MLIVINKKNGRAHRADCYWIQRIPESMLRRVEVTEWPPPRLRLCSVCFAPPRPADVTEPFDGDAVPVKGA